MLFSAQKLLLASLFFSAQKILLAPLFSPRSRSCCLAPFFFALFECHRSWPFFTSGLKVGFQYKCFSYSGGGEYRAHTLSSLTLARPGTSSPAPTVRSVSVWQWLADWAECWLCHRSCPHTADWWRSLEMLAQCSSLPAESRAAVHSCSCSRRRPQWLVHLFHYPSSSLTQWALGWSCWMLQYQWNTSRRSHLLPLGLSVLLQNVHTVMKTQLHMVQLYLNLRTCEVKHVYIITYWKYYRSTKQTYRHNYNYSVICFHKLQ